MLKNKIIELEAKVGEAKKELVEALNEKYYIVSHIADKVNEFIILASQLECLEELQEEIK